MGAPYLLMPPTILTVKTAYYFWGAVLTNCGYEPVMMSIVRNETSDTVQTALQHLKYRTGLSPKFITQWMAFLETQQLIYLFHAKRNWKTKLSSTLEEENAEDAVRILSKLTTAMSQEEYNNGLADLYNKP